MVQSIYTISGTSESFAWGAVLTWFQWLSLVSKQKLFRWEQIQLEFSMIFTRPFNTPDLQFPSFSNENLDHLGKNKLNLMLLPYICPGFPLSISLAPTVSCLPPCSTHPLTHSGPPSTTPWEMPDYKSPSTSHWPQPETRNSFFRLHLTPFLKCPSTLALGHRKESHLIIFKLLCFHS